MNFDYLPDELILSILVDLPILDLMHFCQTDKRIQNLCFDERLWKQRVLNEFGHNQKHRNLTWRQFYTQLSNGQIRFIDVTYLGNYVGQIIVSYFDTFHQVKRSILLLLRSVLKSQIANVNVDIRFHDESVNTSNFGEYSPEQQFGTATIITYHDMPPNSKKIIHGPPIWSYELHFDVTYIF